MTEYGLGTIIGVLIITALVFPTPEILEWTRAQWPLYKAKWTEFFAPVKSVEQDSPREQPPVIYLSTDIVC